MAKNTANETEKSREIRNTNKKQVESVQLETRKQLIEQLISYRKAKKITQESRDLI